MQALDKPHRAIDREVETSAPLSPVHTFFEGGILESGLAPDLVTKPTCRYTAEFLATSPKLTHFPHELSTISAEAIAEAEAIIHGGDGILPSAEAE